MLFFFFKQKTAYEMRISDWSSDVCSSDLIYLPLPFTAARRASGSTQHKPEAYSKAFRHLPHAIFVSFRSLQRTYASSAKKALPCGRARLRLTKLGRASCRERGCQNV